MDKVADRLKTAFQKRNDEYEAEKKKALERDMPVPPKLENDFPEIKDWSVLVVDSLASRGEDRFNFAKAIGDKATVLSFEMMEAMVSR
jgi:hypothetical protein